jgi:hypothetical protein
LQLFRSDRNQEQSHSDAILCELAIGAKCTPNAKEHTIFKPSFSDAHCRSQIVHNNA